jgi:fatty acid/phospholipid biosynthesis enzyme
MKLSHILLVLLYIMGGCHKGQKIIESLEVSEIAVTQREKKRKILITNPDSINVIINEFNKAQSEPIKFYPTHQLVISYKNGSEILVYCSGASLKVDGISFKMGKTIEEIIAGAVPR